MQLILNVEFLYDQVKITSFFVHSLTSYLHLTSTKNLKDLAGTRGLITKSRQTLQRKKVPSKKNLSLAYYIELYSYLDQILFAIFS